MQKMSITMIVILLFVQIMSNGFAQIPATNNDETLDTDIETPALTSARNNTSCGSNSSLTDLWASTDSSGWATWTGAVLGYYLVNCTVAGNNYLLEATIEITSQQTANGSAAWSSYSSWNWNETNNSEYMSEAWTNLTAGETYCVNATLWEIIGNTTNYVDSDYPCFTLTNSSGSGGNNTGGNNSSSMEQINLLYIAPWGMNYTTNDTLYFYWDAEDLVTNISYNATFDVYAYNVTTNNTYVIWDDYTIFDSNSTNWNPAWNGSGPSFDSHWIIPNGTLPTGCYYVSINLYDNDDGMYFDNDGSDLDVGVDCSNTGGNNTGGNNTGGNNTGGNNTGGNNTNQLTYNAYQLQYCFSTAEDIEIFMTINGLNATQFYLEWEITSGSTIVASGSPLISVNSSGTVSYTWTINSSALSSGVYTVMLNPADSGLSNLFSNSPFYYNIEVGCNNTGGNNTGGNNTGGNNTGGNNNTNCGNSSTLTDLIVWTDATTYTVGDSVLGNFFVNCTINGETYKLDYEVIEFNTNTVHSDGVWNWTEQNNWEAFNPIWIGLPAGEYCIHSTLEILTAPTYSFVDYEATCFDVWNATGGNNTGGNNTGGNSPTNPLMPVINCSQIMWNASMNVTINDCLNQTNSFWFFFNQSGAVVWIDPVVAVGYDYVVYSGPSIVSVEIPLGYGDDVFDLYYFGTNGWYDSNIDIYGGVTYTFSTPVERMSIRGIEASEMLDPNDPTAFVSALTFQNSGTVLMTMTPVTENYTVLTCGNDPSMTDLMIWTDAQSYPQGTTVYSDYYVNCSVNTKDYELHVFAYSTSGGTWSDYAVWNWTETDSYEMMDDSWSNLAQDTYCVNATLYMVSGGAYQFVDFEVTCFTVTGNSSGGGGSTPLDPCGLNSSYTVVWSWMDASTYANGDDQDATFYVNCTRTGAAYILEYYVFEVGTTNYLTGGMETWIATSVNINFYDTFTGLGPGDYCLLANLYEANVFLTDNGGTTCFTIIGAATNSPPTIAYTMQIPIAYSGDALDCYAQGAYYSDPDNDPDQSIFTWNINNVQISTGILNNILPAGSFVVGDIVHCEAIAHDGMAQGNTMNRYYFVQPANNTAPSVSNVIITPPSPVATDTLTCSYTYSDPDMDPDASLIQWSINGVAVPGATTDTLSSGYTTADFITCTVTAFDGTVNGNTGTMSILIMSRGSSGGGGGLPSIGIAGTIAAISAGFIFATRREDEE